MQLSQQAIDDFKKIYFQQFKVKLTDKEANTKGLELLHFINLIYRPAEDKDFFNKLTQEGKK